MLSLHLLVLIATLLSLGVLASSNEASDTVVYSKSITSTNASCIVHPVVSARDRLDKVFGSPVREKRVPGIAAIALNRDGTIIYKNAWGTVNINDPSSAPITSSTRMGIASMTKAVTAVAALQLIEQGRLNLDDLVEEYLPAWKNISVLTGFDPKGQPILRQPRTKAKIINLFTHTSGQPYQFLSDNIQRYNTWARNQSGTLPPTPLSADPGTGWSYGGSLDTLGNVIETITNQRLDTYFEAYIFRPLGIRNSGLITPEIHSHRRQNNGTITAAPPSPVYSNSTPGGGAFLTSTLDDYSNFLVTLLNWGTHPQMGNTILHSKTVKNYLYTDLIPRAVPSDTCNFQKTGVPVGLWTSNDPALSRSNEFLPGIRKGWSAGFLTNNDDVPGRRRAGSGAWAGINNLFYWIDPKSGKLGVVFTNLLPFLDPQILALFDSLEEEIYKL